MSYEKIMVLHITDIHMSTFDVQLKNKMNRLVECLRQYKKIDRLFVVFSGDLVKSGLSKQYDCFCCFCEMLENLVVGNEIVDEKRIHFIASPGNHDIKYRKWFKRRRKNIPINENDFYKQFQKSLAKFENYYSFQAKQGSSTKINDLLYLYDYKIDKIKMNFYSFNNVVFSYFNSKINEKDREKGRVYIPDKYFPNIPSKPNEMNFLIMHFPPSFFCDETASLFNNFISNFDCLLCGHLHSDAFSIDFNDKNCLVSQSNCFHNNPDLISEFQIVIYENLCFKKITYALNADNNMYNVKGAPIVMQINDSSTYSYDGFSFSKSFLSELFEDSIGISKAGSFLDYFVFPDFSYENDYLGNTINGKIHTYEEFCKITLKYKFTNIIGSYGSGRTTILSYLCRQFSNKGLCLFVDASKFNYVKEQRYYDVISDAIAKQYSTDCIEKFKQTKSNNLFLFLDNFENANFPLSIIKYLMDYFGHIYYTTDKYKSLFELNDLLSDKEMFYPKKEEGINIEIEAYYKTKRSKLILRVYQCILSQRLENFDQNLFDIFYRKIENIISSKLSIINLNPLSIIMLTRQLMSSSIGNESTLYTDLYASNIHLAISKACTRLGIPDERFYGAVMQYIAFDLNKNRQNHFDLSFVEAIIKSFNKERRGSIDPIKFIKLFSETHIIAKDNTGKYHFSNKSYYAFFVSKEYQRKMGNNSIKIDELNYLLDNTFDGMNTSILLFIACSQQNVAILNYIINKIETRFKGYSEFDFNSFSLLKDTRMSINKFSLLNETEKKTKIEEAEKREKEIITTETNENNLIFIDKKLNGFEKEIHLMMDHLELLSTIFASFAHMMESDMQDNNIRGILTLSNKLIYKYNILIDKYKTDLVAFLQKQLEANNHKVTEKTLLQFLRRAILAFVLGIYDFSARNISDEGAYKVFAKTIKTFPYNETYILQKLMVQSFVLAPEVFASEAVKIYKDNEKNNIFITCVRIIVTRFYYDHPEIISEIKNKEFIDIFVNDADKKMLFFQKKKD